MATGLPPHAPVLLHRLCDHSIPFVATLQPKTETLKQQAEARRLARRCSLFMSSVTSFLLAVSWGGIQHPWDGRRTLVPLALGSLGLLYGFLHYAPLYYIAVRHTSYLKAGVNMIPKALTFIPSSIIVGGLMACFHHFRCAVWSGWLIVTISTGMLVLWGADTPSAIWIPIVIIVGTGHGLILSAQNFATKAIALPQDEASAAAMYMFLRSLGAANGAVIGGSVFQNIMAIKLRHYGLSTDITKNAEACISILCTQSKVDPIKHEQILRAYVYGNGSTFGFFCGLAGLAELASLCIKHSDTNKKLDSDHKLGQMRGRRASKHHSCQDTPACLAMAKTSTVRSRRMAIGEGLVNSDRC
ncbi:hypothetical protein FKW77_005788 [Venturia effusa]|uniref:Major facilitator superfamily (MFS) profile domain-containing protein n=1 Tax=Venturia effusa TaxID=50376 RepID=A0A517LDT1_9PEZI|nr:hypothetical protein FKW77_005788 [Venturia effusa]